MNEERDTICALITSARSPARCALRLSGPGVPHAHLRLLGAPWEGRYEAKRLSFSLGSWHVPALILTMPEGKSYTKEDVLEIHLPANPSLAHQLQQTIYEMGIRPAGPGEFTRRAYLNGRINLREAQSVAALISANDETDRRQALSFLRGESGDQYREIKEVIFAFRRDLEAVIDFPEEPDIEAHTFRWKESLNALASNTQTWKGQEQRSAAPPPLLRILILGPANSGKSSLVQRLIPGSQPVISHIEGTTLDLIPYPWDNGEERALLYDSPGLKSIEGELDRLSLGQLQHRLHAFDAYLLLSATGEPEPDWPSLPAGAPVLRFETKVDLGIAPTRHAGLSCVSGEGLTQLKNQLQQLSQEHRKKPSHSLEAIRSHLILRLEETCETLKGLLFGPHPQEELAAYELDELLDILDGSVGEEGGHEALLDSVFRDFCIGK